MPRHCFSLVFLILFWESFKFKTFFDVYTHLCLEIRGPVTTVSICLHSCSIPSILLLLSVFLSWSLTHIPDTLFHRDECNDVGQPTYDLFSCGIHQGSNELIVRDGAFLERKTFLWAMAISYVEPTSGGFLWKEDLQEFDWILADQRSLRSFWPIFL